MNKQSTPNPPTHPERLLYSLKEAAYMLSISKRSLAYLCAQGHIPTRKIGGRTLISSHALQVFAGRGVVINIVPCRRL